MPQCVVYGCGQQSGKGVSLYRFPDKKKDKARYKQWVNAAHTTNVDYHVEPVMCASHFEDSQLDESFFLRSKLLPGSIKCIPLKATAVPTLRLGVSTLKTKTGCCSSTPPVKKMREESVLTKKKRINDILCHPPIENDYDTLPIINVPVIYAPTVSAITLSATTVSSGIVTNPIASVPIESDLEVSIYSDHHGIIAPNVLNTVLEKQNSNVIKCKTFSESGVQCELGCELVRAYYPNDRELQDRMNDSDSNVNECKKSDAEEDSDYDPSREEVGSDDEDYIQPILKKVVPRVSDYKLQYENAYYLVKFDSIMMLFENCQKCGKELINKKAWTTGTMLSVRATCIDGHVQMWSSQPRYCRQPEGNVLLSAAVLLSGTSYTSFLQLAESMKLQTFTYKVHLELEKKYTERVVVKTYDEEHDELYQDILKVGTLRLGGDGQFDSRGHCADNCTYTMQDVDSKKLIDFFVITKNMHQGDLERAAFNILLPQIVEKLPVTLFASDRHVGIRCDMKNLFPQIAHEFDPWHVAKGLTKKLTPVAAKHDKLLPWKKSITNHLWWSCQSSGGDGELAAEKFLSIRNHILNQHSWTGNKLFHKCEHGPLGNRRPKR